MDQPPAVAFTAFADAWPGATETEIGAALCAIGRGKDFDLHTKCTSARLQTVCTKKRVYLLRHSKTCMFLSQTATRFHIRVL